jgi:hypothetical protein
MLRRGGKFDRRNFETALKTEKNIEKMYLAYFSDLSTEFLSRVASLIEESLNSRNKSECLNV